MTNLESALTYKDGAWRISDQKVSEIAAEFGTPTFVYDKQTIEAQYQALRGALPDNVDIYYSIKANPNPAIVQILSDVAAGLEIASAAEYEIACSTGLDSERIVFAGPGKAADEIEHVLKRGLGELHLESYEEIEIVEKLGIPANVSVRFNPAAEASGGAMRMGGKPSQFGFDEEHLPDVFDRVMSSPSMRLSGLHMFAGTQLLDADVLLSQWSHAVTVARRMASILGAPLRTVDLGGGLGIPYFPSESALDLSSIRSGAAELFGGLTGDPLFDRTKFIVEPGRFLVGPAGFYVARVLSVKDSRGSKFVVVDGGMNHHLAASGNLGQVIKKDYPITNVSKSEDMPQTTNIVVGPLCTPLDTLGRRVSLPDTKVGDLIVISQSGAYGLSASPVGFLSHRQPAEILIDRDRKEIIRMRGSFSNPYGSVS